jgi:hypothetical protein
MLAGETPAARGSAPFGLLRRGLPRRFVGPSGVARAKDAPQARPRAGRTKDEGRAVEHHLDMVGGTGRLPK